jgi:hypothetical protein
MFDIFKVYDLSYLGENWKGCNLKFNSFTLADIEVVSNVNKENAVEEMVKVLQSKFIDGQAIKGGIKVKVVKEDLISFPVEVLNDLFVFFTKGMDKKKSLISTTASEDTATPLPNS